MMIQNHHLGLPLTQGRASCSAREAGPLARHRGLGCPPEPGVQDVVCLVLRGSSALSAAIIGETALGYCTGSLALHSLGASPILSLAATILPASAGAFLAWNGANRLSDAAGLLGRQALGRSGELLGRTVALAGVLGACAAITMALS